MASEKLRTCGVCNEFNPVEGQVALLPNKRLIREGECARRSCLKHVVWEITTCRHGLTTKEVCHAQA